MSFDAVYVSPHPDDVVFSCGGAIALAARAGRRVAVATVFTRGEDAEASDARRREDRAAIERLGAVPVDLDLPEAPARDRQLLKPSRLFAPLGDGPPELVADVRARIAATAAGAPVIAPLGVGRHVDHQVVHRACAGFDGVTYYEDIPYALAGESVARRLAELAGERPTTGLHDLWSIARWWGQTPLLRGRAGLFTFVAAGMVASAQWRSPPSVATLRLAEERVDVSAAADDKLDAIAAYTTQWCLFFDSLPSWRAALDGYGLRLGAPGMIERIWRPSEDARSPAVRPAG